MKIIILGLIKFYKRFISPILSFFGIHCKYYPTCSEYTKQAIEKYGVIKPTKKGWDAGQYLLYRHDILHEFLFYCNINIDKKKKRIYH